MQEVANLVVKLDYDPRRVHSVKLEIPMLAVDEHLTHVTRIDNLVAGTYDGVLTTFLSTGGETKQRVKIKLFAKQDNVHHFNLNVPNEVVLRPVDKKNKTIMFSEIMVENIDSNFRPVRDEKGVTLRLRPGDYTIRVVLPNMEVKKFPLKVTEETLVYSLPLYLSDEAASRKEPRVQMAVPVSYKSKDGNWVATKTINISSSGICLIRPPDKPADPNVQVRLVVPVSANPVECHGSVKWEKPDSQNPQMGLELVLPEQLKTTIAKWLTTKR